MKTTQKRTVSCPQCQKKTEYSPENPFRPFCSDRCKLLDLGAWADESFKIPTPENAHESVNENSDTDSEIN